jgi:hypothetical protein
LATPVQAVTKSGVDAGRYEGNHSIKEFLQENAQTERAGTTTAINEQKGASANGHEVSK